jgi:hypothetical protein
VSNSTLQHCALISSSGGSSSSESRVVGRLQQAADASSTAHLLKVLGQAAINPS